MPEHLRIEREVPVTERHRRPDLRPRFRPEDARQFGRDLGGRLQAARTGFREELEGYDQRLLLKIVLRSGESLPNIEAIPGIELVSQEDRSVVLAFATNDGIGEVEARLSTLARDGTVTRAQLLYAIEDFTQWTPEDRTGNALREEGFPPEEPFTLDVELWPQERADHRDLMINRFGEWLVAQGMEHLDTLAQPSLVMVRVRCSRQHAENGLLRYRDVRTVDLPPRFGIELQTLLTDIGEIPPPIEPAEGASSITVLDSGLTTGHPLVAAAVGDAQGFVPPDRGADDRIPEGHGTFVSGLALYGDLSAAVSRRRLVPSLRLFSGKVLKDDGTDQTEFVERAVEEAVRYFRSEYNCRVFNLSYGDLNKVYDGRHLRSLAYTVDHLSRSLDVLFVVSSGNRMLNTLPRPLRDRYPDYLFEAANRVLDPGTALNAITVGGLAQHDATLAAQRYPNHIETVAVAGTDQPSPITRCGPSVSGAVKPDFVEFSGNVAVDRLGNPQTRGLGVLSLNSGFAAGRPLCEDIGTSYAAPMVAHKAAKLLGELAGASPNLLRALLGVHAAWPDACVELLDPHRNADGKDKLLRATGYGRIEEGALYQSLDRIVTLVAEETIDADRHHFFRVPVPGGWWRGGRRWRRVRVALAYAPESRTTRLDYRATKMRFYFVNADNLDDVTAAFRRNREDGMEERQSNRRISGDKRNGGTLQVSEWRFGQRPQRGGLFVVVTRQDAAWSRVSDQPESYALAIVLDDRQRAEADLYAEVRAELQARARVRIQV